MKTIEEAAGTKLATSCSHVRNTDRTGSGEPDAEETEAPTNNGQKHGTFQVEATAFLTAHR